MNFISSNLFTISCLKYLSLENINLGVEIDIAFKNRYQIRNSSVCPGK